MCHNKKNLKFGNYKRSLKAIQLEHKVKELETSKFNVDSSRENYKEIIKKQWISIKYQNNISKVTNMYLLNALTRLHCVLTIIKKYNPLTQ